MIKNLKNNTKEIWKSGIKEFEKRKIIKPINKPMKQGKLYNLLHIKFKKEWIIKNMCLNCLYKHKTMLER